MIQISVVMSCYNSQKTVRKAIESILRQSFVDFEFIIINDGSTDNTLHIMEEYSNTDDRIIIINNDHNIGLAASLNKGIQSATSQLIARMDADDISFESRLEKQFQFLSANDGVDILGSAIIEMNQDGESLTTQTLPKEHRNIIKRIFRGPLVYHPTIMIRKKIYDNIGTYNPDITWAEDADLWYRIYDKVTFHNLQEPLLYYTVKDKLSLKHVTYNLKVKYKNLQRRGKLISHVPQLFRDVLVLSLKMIR